MPLHDVGWVSDSEKYIGPDWVRDWVLDTLLYRYKSSKGPSLRGTDKTKARYLNYYCKDAHTRVRIDSSAFIASMMEVEGFCTLYPSFELFDVLREKFGAWARKSAVIESIDKKDLPAKWRLSRDLAPPTVKACETVEYWITRKGWFRVLHEDDFIAVDREKFDGLLRKNYTVAAALAEARDLVLPRGYQGKFFFLADCQKKARKEASIKKWSAAAFETAQEQLRNTQSETQATIIHPFDMDDGQLSRLYETKSDPESEEDAWLISALKWSRRPQ